VTARFSHPLGPWSPVGRTSPRARPLACIGPSPRQSAYQSPVVVALAMASFSLRSDSSLRLLVFQSPVAVASARVGLGLPIEFPPRHWFSPSGLQHVVAAGVSTVGSCGVRAPRCLLIQARGPTHVLLPVGVSFCGGSCFIKIRFSGRDLVCVSLQ
jgi:hypothetical protein